MSDNITFVWSYMVDMGGLTVPNILISCFVSYLIGCNSPAILIAKSQGIDIKKEGSGNAGSTNMLRVVGKKAALMTLVLDIVKGIIAVLLVGMVMGEDYQYFAALCVFLGHIFPFRYKFKGGKGVATAFGSVIAVNPLMALILAILVLSVIAITRRVSPGAIFAGIIFPIFTYFMENDFFTISLVMAFILILKHRANIKRLIKGEESKLSFSKKEKKDE